MLTYIGNVLKNFVYIIFVIMVTVVLSVGMVLAFVKFGFWTGILSIIFVISMAFSKGESNEKQNR